MSRPSPLERAELVQHIANLTAHVELLSRQIVGLGAVPLPPPDGAHLVVAVESALGAAAQIAVLPVAPRPAPRRPDEPPREPRVITALRALGEATTQQLAEHLGSTYATMSVALCHPAVRGRLTKRRLGRTVIYRLASEPVGGAHVPRGTTSVPTTGPERAPEGEA